MNNLLEFYALIDEKLLYLMTRCRRWRHFLGLPIEFWKSGKSIGVFPVLQGIFLEISTEMGNIYMSFIDCIIESHSELLTVDLDLWVPLLRLELLLWLHGTGKHGYTTSC